MEVKPNAIYRYDKGSGWCKHGIVYTYKNNGEIYCADTYWDSTFRGIIKNGYANTETIYKANKIAKDLEYVMDIKDVQQVDERTFDQYNEKDKIYIPIGGWHERYLINKTVKPNNQLKVDQLKCEIESLKWQIESTQRKLEDKQKELEHILDA